MLNAEESFVRFQQGVLGRCVFRHQGFVFILQGLGQDDLSNVVEEGGGEDDVLVIAVFLGDELGGDGGRPCRGRCARAEGRG